MSRKAHTMIYCGYCILYTNIILVMRSVCVNGKNIYGFDKNMATQMMDLEQKVKNINIYIYILQAKYK